MVDSMISVNMLGTLKGDLKEIKNGVRFSLSVKANTNTSYNFVDCVAFGSVAEYILKYGNSKDTVYYVIGELTFNTYKNKSGFDTKTFNVLVSNVELKNNKFTKDNQSSSAPQPSSNETVVAKEEETNEVDGVDITDDSLPF